MCLSAVYELRGPDHSLICQHVSSVAVEGKTLRFTDIMGGETVLTGAIEKIDLVNNAILVRPEDEAV